MEQQQPNIKKRDVALDITRGLAILCVVFAHSLMRYGYADAVIDGTYFNILYMFNVAVILFVSGYLVYGKTSAKWIAKYTVKLVLPLISFIFVTWFSGHYFGVYRVGDSLEAYLQKEFTTGAANLVLWFLWTLLLCHIITTVFEYIIKAESMKTFPMWLSILGLIVTLNLLPYNGLNFDTVKWYGIFYYSGYYLRHIVVNYKNRYKNIFNTLKYCCLLGSIPAMIIFGVATDWLKGFGYPYAFAGYTNALYTIKTTGWYGVWIVTCLILAFSIKTALFYTVAKILLAIKVKGLRLIGRSVIYCGASSIGIYLIHTNFVKLGDSAWIGFGIAMVASIVLYEIFKRWKWSNFILFGGSNMPDKIVAKLSEHDNDSNTKTKSKLELIKNDKVS